MFSNHGPIDIIGPNSIATFRNWGAPETALKNNVGARALDDKTNTCPSGSRLLADCRDAVKANPQQSNTYTGPLETRTRQDEPLPQPTEKNKRKNRKTISCVH
jgi:hypothetical protein